VSKPELKRNIKIESGQVQYAFNKLFTNVDDSLFYLTAVIYQSDEKSFNEFKIEFESMLESYMKRLETYDETISDSLKNNGLALCSYSSDLIVETTEKTRLSTEFLRFLIKMDGVIKLIDSAWIHGLIEDKKRNDMTDSIQQLAFDIAHLCFRKKHALYHSINKDN